MKASEVTEFEFVHLELKSQQHTWMWGTFDAKHPGKEL
jgi:hypothetical protein